MLTTGFSFSDHIEVLEQFLAGRRDIVDDIERRLLNVRGEAAGQHSDRRSLDDMINGCFFESPAVSRDAPRLKGQLAAAHLIDGFEMISGDVYSRELDPVELILRAHHQWNRDRRPGRNGRIVYAQSLYAVFILRELEHLSLRIWDDGNDMATERLREVQRILDLMNTTVAAPRVRDARWLMQTAQGPLTRHLKPYFTIADLVSRILTPAERIEIHKAGSVLAGGHLRSQLRHRALQTGWAFDDPQLVAMTRLSNSMDTALLVRDLIPLLEAYSAACSRQDTVDNDEERMKLADAILQGLSADPELLLTRLDLLAPLTMIEDLFIDQDGQTRYTPMGEAHLDCLSRYGELIGRTAESLMKDAIALDPAHAAYSPLGIVYGFCADLLSNMVLNTLRSASSADLSLEDMFIGRGQLERKRAQAQEWQRLPKGEGERDPFEHSLQWATQMFGRMLTALEARVARPTEPNASAYPHARLYVVPRGVTIDSLPAGVLPPRIASAQEHCLMSDSARARETGATVLSKSRLSNDRAEGRFLGSQDAGGSWFGVSKAPLTICTSLGKDAFVTDVPRAVIDVLRLVCQELLVVVDENKHSVLRDEGTSSP
jgi:hypothetical protein